MSMNTERELREVIRTEIRRTVTLPAVTDTRQSPVAAPATLTRTGAATWNPEYYASGGNLPEDDA